MNKTHISILIFIFALFFSGKSLSKNNLHENCSVDITFNSSSPYPVTMVSVLNLTTNVIDNYDNPTFPFNGGGSNGQYRVSYYFDSRKKYSGSFWFNDPISGCHVTHFLNTNSATQVFTPYCGGSTSVDLTDDATESCP